MAVSPRKALAWALTAIGGVILLLILVVAVVWLLHSHQTSKTRAHLITQVAAFAESSKTGSPGASTQYSEGQGLAYVRFLDDDWAAVAHHSRHARPNVGFVGDITVALMSDGEIYEAYMHYCRDWVFKQWFTEDVYTNRADFMTRHFGGPLTVQLNADAGG